MLDCSSRDGAETPAYIYAQYFLEDVQQQLPARIYSINFLKITALWFMRMKLPIFFRRYLWREN